jgi:hypothetical protein
MIARLLPLLIIFAIAAGTLPCFPEEVEVPKGVVYKTVDQATDTKARKAVADAFAGGSSKILLLCPSAIICGPGYWTMIKDDPAIQAADTIPSNFKIPNTTTGEVTTLTGGTFKDDAAKKALAGRLAADIGKQPLIRKLRPDELSLYWAIIPFDIQEPVYILEAGKKRFLLNLVADKDQFSLLWVDELSGISLGDGKAFAVANLILYQPDEVLTARLPGAKEFAVYVKQLEAVAADFFGASKTPESIQIVVAVRPGKQAHVWFISTKRAGDAKDFDPLRAKLEAVTPIAVRGGPIAFAISAKIAGGDGDNAPDVKDFKPPIPKEWTDATRDAQSDIPVPDGFLDAVWPASK